MRKLQIHKIFCLCLLALPSLLEAQSDNNGVVKDTVDVKKTTYSRFTDIRLGSSTDSLQFNFDTITEGQFIGFKTKSSLRIDTNSNKISLGENSFQLTAADTTFIFGCEEWKFCHRYHGYYPDLDSYLIGVAGNEIYETFFIERATAKGLPVPPLYDAAIFNPSISPDKKFMLIYGTCGDPYNVKYFGDLSAMILVDISQMNQLQDLHQKPFKEFSTKDWVIDELVWIDSNKIALRICDSYTRHGEPVNIRYLKAEIKWKNTGANTK